MPTLPNSNFKTTKPYRLHRLADVNIINLVDVTMVLLIIFILVAPMIREGIEVDLPETTTSRHLSQKEALTVTLTKDHQIFFNDRPQSLESLRAVLMAEHERDPSVPILIKADGSVTYREFVNVADTIRQSGFARFGMVTQPPQPETR